MCKAPGFRVVDLPFQGAEGGLLMGSRCEVGYIG